MSYLADLESDFSRFHRVDDIFAMDGPRFMRMAWRIAAYQGVLMVRLQEEVDRQPGGSNSSGRQEERVEFASVALNHSDLFERTRV